MLPYTADVLFASFEQYNQGLWPLPGLAWLLGLAAVGLAFRPVPQQDRAIAALLACGWLWTGYGYHYLHFGTLNFAAPVYAVLFVLEGLFLVWTGVVRCGLRVRFHPDLFGWAGLTVTIAALVLLPVADWLSASTWSGVRVVGLAPAPTALFTLGLLLLCEPRPPVYLAIIPLLWTLIAGASAWVLTIPQDQALAVAGMVAFALIVWKNRQRARS